MIAFILAPQNLPFTIALGIMIAIGLLEGISTVLGFGLSSFIDSILPDIDLDLDVDADIDADVDLDGDAPNLSEIGSATALSRLFGWMNIGRVPVLVLMVLFLFGFGITGLIVQSVAENTFGGLLPGIAATVPSLVIGIFFMKILGRMVAHIVPKEETDAVSEKSFVGRVAVITTGRAKVGQPAQGKVYDRHGHPHYVMVEPETGEDIFETGSQVLLVKQEGARFVAINNPNAALVDQPEDDNRETAGPG